MSNILLPNEFELENVGFNTPRRNNMGGQNILMSYTIDSNQSPIIFQTPRIRVPFGLDERDDGAGPKYSINVSLAFGENQNANLVTFTDNIRSIDKFVKEQASEKSESWFEKKMKPDVIDELFRSCEKKPKDEAKWPSTLKLKLPFRDGKPQFEIYDDAKKKLEIMNDGVVNLDCIQKGCEIVALIQCTGVYFVGKTQFGIGWKILQMKIFQTNKLVGYSIVDDESDGEELEGEEEGAATAENED